MTLPARASAPDIFDDDPWGEPVRLKELLALRPTVVVFLPSPELPVSATVLAQVGRGSPFGAGVSLLLVVQAPAQQLAGREELRQPGVSVCADAPADVARLYMVPRDPVLASPASLLNRAGARRALGNLLRRRPARQTGDQVRCAAFVVDQDGRVLRRRVANPGEAVEIADLAEGLAPPEDRRSDKQRRRDERRAARRARLASMADAGRTARATDTDPESGDAWSPTAGMPTAPETGA